MNSFAIRIAVVLAVLAGIGFYVFFQYWYYIPGLLQAIRDPVQANHEVSWEKGPDAAPAPISERKPNIILIVADDLGYNDITASSGGVADGAVPTPNINSNATGGANLTHSYSGTATCAPTTSPARRELLAAASRRAHVRSCATAPLTDDNFV